MMAEQHRENPTSEQVRCELCIVGAGIAGMNALFVASQYLSAEDRVILIDTNPTPGGMWRDTYDYVRLHQPHLNFTAGNIPWTLGQPRHYLATKDEVLGQFDHCLDVLEDRVTLIEYFGCRYEGHEEVAHDGKYEVDVQCRRVSDEALINIHAKRLIKAVGFRIRPNPPLQFSSSDVRSVSPHDQAIFGTEMADSDKPVYIVGGGKTGMDTAHALITRFPDKAIHLLVGNGTVFSNRNHAFPAGLRRYWAGKPGLDTFLDVALRFNGDNTEEVFKYFSRTYALGLDERCRNFVFGVISEEENATIKRGVASVTRDYVEDIIDRDGRPTLLLRDGGTCEIESGSWVINCSGYVLRDEYSYEPYLSQHGTTVSIQPTSAIHILTTFGAYFLVHLFYLDLLDKLPIYELDQQALGKIDKEVLPFVCISQIVYNIALISNAVPLKVMQDCGLDFDRMFPTYRRLPGFIKLNRNREKYLRHLRTTLDRIQQRYDVRCGLLTQQTAGTPLTPMKTA